MWEITLVFDSNDISDICAFKEGFYKECKDKTLFLSEAVNAGDCILSIAVSKDNIELIRLVKLELTKLLTYM